MSDNPKVYPDTWNIPDPKIIKPWPRNWAKEEKESDQMNTHTKQQTVFVVVKNSRRYSSGQLEHLAEYFFDRAEADERAAELNVQSESNDWLVAEEAY